MSEIEATAPISAMEVKTTARVNPSTTQHALYDYALRLGDTTLILAQRYCEWVGKAPTIEEELSLANIGLDTLGQTMAWLDIAAKNDSKQRDADTLAYFRGEREYTNYLLAELENGDFAVTTLRGFLISTYLKFLYQDMQKSSVKAFRDVAIKAFKEVEYHSIHQRAWLVRLGNGTSESHQRLQAAIDVIWAYTAELFEQDDTVKAAHKLGIIQSMTDIQQRWRKEALDMVDEAKLDLPQEKYHHRGGITGNHTEKLGLLLAEMQAVRRQFPTSKW